MFKCNSCNKSYASQNSLNKHARQTHGLRRELVLYECENCQPAVSFTSKRKLKDHNCRHHKPESRPNQKNILCPIEECKGAFDKYTSLHTHLTNVHSLDIIQEKYEFKTESEFNEWKKQKEEELKANYVKNTGGKFLKGGEFRAYYVCHRSMPPRIFVRSNKRKSKAMGTNKIGRACPSILIVTSTSENISVVFYPNHVGHCKDLGRLRIDKFDRDKIAGKLLQGDTINRVLNDIRDNAPDGEVKRIQLVKKKDIHNIMRDYSIKYSTPQRAEAATTSAYSLQKELIPHNSDKKKSIESKLNVILGLNKKCALSNDNFTQIEKNLDKIIGIYTDMKNSSRIEFKAKQNVNTNEKLESQTKMFTFKSKKRKLDTADSTTYLLPSESKIIKIPILNCSIFTSDVTTTYPTAL